VCVGALIISSTQGRGFFFTLYTPFRPNDINLRSAIYKVKKNPLTWVEEMINAPTHTNFFENLATDYAKGALSGDWSDVWAH